MKIDNKLFTLEIERIEGGFSIYFSIDYAFLWLVIVVIAFTLFLITHSSN